MSAVELAVNDNDSRIDFVTTSVFTLANIVDDNMDAIDALDTRTTSLESRVTQAEADIAAMVSDSYSGLRTEMEEGFAITNALDVFLPDPGANFRMNLGLGFYDGTTAIGVTGSGRIDGGPTALYFGVSAVPNSDNRALGGKAGVSFQW